MLAKYARFAVMEQTAFDAIPEAALRRLNITSGLSMGRNRSTGRPGIYTSDRRLFPNVILQEDGPLTIPSIWQHRNMTPLLEGLAMNDIAAAATPVTATDISATSGVIASVGETFTGFAVGDWVILEGAGIAPNVAGIFYGPIQAVAAGQFTLPAAQVQDFVAGGSVTVHRPERLLDGEVIKHYVAQWNATKLTNAFKNGIGYTVGQGVHTWEQGGFVTESYTLMGKKPEGASATVGTGADTLAPTGPFYNAVTNFGRLWLFGTAGIGTPTPLIVTNITQTITNALVGIYGLGSQGPSAIDVGSMEGTQLQVTARFDDDARTALADRIDAHETMGVAWEVLDALGNRALWFHPALKPDAGDEGFGDPDTVVYLPVTFSSHDPAKDSTSPLTGGLAPYQWALFTHDAP
jgi:hypothetical protein